MKRNGSNGRPKLGTPESFRAKAAESLLDWSARGAPTRFADADEPLDPIERPGFSAVRDDIAAEPTSCLGFACPLPSELCGVNCKLRVVSEDEETFVIRSLIVQIRERATREMEFARCSPISLGARVPLPREPSRIRREVLSELFEHAPNSRGKRLFAVLVRARRFRI